MVKKALFVSIPILSNAAASGVRAGTIAGLTLLIAECAASLVLGGSFLAPPRLAASAILGPGALSPLFPIPGAFVLGTIVFLLLGGLYGGLLALALDRRNARPRTPVILAISAGYAAVIWIVNGLTVGPLLFFQVAVLDLLWQGFVAHTLGFGLVLGMLLARDWSRLG
jgi:hypothetical protein